MSGHEKVIKITENGKIVSKLLYDQSLAVRLYVERVGKLRQHVH